MYDKFLGEPSMKRKTYHIGHGHNSLFLCTGCAFSHAITIAALSASFSREATGVYHIEGPLADNILIRLQLFRKDLGIDLLQSIVEVIEFDAFPS